jgi:putative transposase
MPNYRRYRVSGGTYFFTVNLLERKQDLLVRHVDDLRDAVRAVKQKRPFHIDAWVVLSSNAKVIRK